MMVPENRFIPFRGSCPSRFFSLRPPVHARSQALLGKPARQFPKLIDPGRGRAAPILPCGSDLCALADAAPAYPPVIRPTLAACKQRRAAFAAEMLKAHAPIVTGFRVD